MAASCASPPAPPDIWGVWIGAQHGQDLTFEFRENGKCRMEFSDQATGEVHGFSGEYQMDFTKQPVPISIRGIPELPHALYAVVDFQPGGTIHFSQFSDRWRLRPLAFEPDKTIVFRRVQLKNNDGRP